MESSPRANESLFGVAFVSFILSFYTIPFLLLFSLPPPLWWSTFRAVSPPPPSFCHSSFSSLPILQQKGGCACSLFFLSFLFHVFASCLFPSISVSSSPVLTASVCFPKSFHLPLLLPCCTNFVCVLRCSSGILSDVIQTIIGADLLQKSRWSNLQQLYLWGGDIGSALELATTKQLLSESVVALSASGLWAYKLWALHT